MSSTVFASPFMQLSFVCVVEILALLTFRPFSRNYVKLVNCAERPSCFCNAVSTLHDLPLSPTQTDCFNYIKILLRLNTTHLYVCGTYAFSPVCAYIVSGSFPVAAAAAPPPPSSALLLSLSLCSKMSLF